MDEYLDCRYKVLKRPSPDLKVYHRQRLKADETKKKAMILASWLMKNNESTFLNLIEEKLADGYQSPEYWCGHCSTSRVTS